jgi:hypothetical protein
MDAKTQRPEGEGFFPVSRTDCMGSLSGFGGYVVESEVGDRQEDGKGKARHRDPKVHFKWTVIRGSQRGRTIVYSNTSTGPNYVREGR